MRSTLFVFVFCLSATALFAEHFEMTARASGNTISVYLKAFDGNIATGFTDIEFFLRNSTAFAEPDFSSATIIVNSAMFPNVLIPYNGKNLQGTEIGYNNYWFGISFALTPVTIYAESQEYLLCTIDVDQPVQGYHLDLCHNEPNFAPHYIALTGDGGADLSNLGGGCKFYGAGAAICQPVNCPATTPGNNHILPLANAPLPVELLDFQAHIAPSGREGILAWHTGIEEISDGEFAIEKRSERDHNWRMIGRTPAKGHDADYSFTDTDLAPGENHYRLHWQTRVENIEYSPIRILRVAESGMVRLAPNPVSHVGSIRITLPERAESVVQAAIYALDGRCVAQFEQTLQTDQHLVCPLSPYRLTDGAYRILLRVEERIYSASLIVSGE